MSTAKQSDLPKTTIIVDTQTPTVAARQVFQTTATKGKRSMSAGVKLVGSVVVEKKPPKKIRGDYR